MVDTSISFFYGFTRPLLTESVLISQLAMGIIYLVISALVLFLTFSTYTPTVTRGLKWILYLRAALVLLFTTFLLLCIRAGLLLKSWRELVKIPKYSYRLEEVFTEDVFAPLANLLVVGVLIHLVNEQRRGVNKFLGNGRTFLGGLQGYFIKAIFLATLCLTITHFALSFTIAHASIKEMKSSTELLWRLGDRDFGLLFDATIVKGLNSRAGGGVNLDWIKSHLFMAQDADGKMPAWVDKREAMIEVGVARDWLLVFMVVFEGFLAAYVWFRKASKLSARGSEEYVAALTWLLVVILPGMMATVMFNAVVATHYCLHNWRVVNGVFPWLAYFNNYFANAQAFGAAATSEDWLGGYRLTPDNFFIVKAVLQPLGLVVALGAIMYLARRQTRVAREEEKLNGLGALEGSMERELPQIRGVGQLDLGDAGANQTRGMYSIDLRD